MLLHIVSSFRLFVIYKLLSCMFAVGSILKVVPFFKCFILRAFEAVSGERLPPSTYWNSLFEQKMLDNIWHSILTDTQKKVKLGCRASNPPVVSTDGKRCFTLLDMSRNGRPLVMSFGSCTCPIFMNRLKEFRKLITDFGHIVDFLVIYIEEAHPADGWAFKNNYDIPNHRSQDERCKAARLLLSRNPGCRVVVDTMLDAANIAYGAMPIRLTAVQDGKLVYDGGAGPMGYRMKDLRLWLQQYSANKH